MDLVSGEKTKVIITYDMSPCENHDHMWNERMIKNEKTQSQGHKILGGESSVLVSDFCIHGIYKKKLDGVFLYF